MLHVGKVMQANKYDFLHFRATIVKVSGAPLSGFCASKRVLADLSSGSSDP